MAAVAVALSFSSVADSISELDALRKMSQEASRVNSFRAAFDIIASIALQVHGVYKLQIEGEKALAAGAVRSRTRYGSAVAEVIPGTVLRLFFDLNDSGLESPVRFARFLAQQIGAVWSLRSLEAENAKLAATLSNLKRILARRKVTRRAIAIICQRHNINEAAAFALMRTAGKAQNCTVHKIADAIVACEPANSRAPRLAPVGLVHNYWPRKTGLM